MGGNADGIGEGGRRGRTPARVDGREGQGAPRGASGGVCRRAGARQRPVHVGVELRERDRTGTVSGVYYLRRYENITNSCRRATSSVSVWPPGQATTPVRVHTASRDPPSDAWPGDASQCRPPPPSPSFPRAPPSSADARATFAREPATSAGTARTTRPSGAMTTPRPVVADSSPPSPPLPSPPPAFLTPRALPRRARSGAFRCARARFSGTLRDADRFDRVAREPVPVDDPFQLLHPRDLQGEIALSDVRYEPSACPPTSTSRTRRTRCVRFTAVATNNLKRKVEAANIFGFVEDKQGNSAVTVNPTGTSRTVLSGLDAPVPRHVRGEFHRHRV